MDALGALLPAITEQAKYVKDLSENVEGLIKVSRLLENKRKDLEREVEEASGKRMRPTHQVQSWLSEEAEVLSEINSIKSQFDAGNSSYMSRFHLGRRAVKLLNNARDLDNRGIFHQVVARSLPPKVMEMPTESTTGQSTTEQTMKEIWDHIHGSENSIICVHGMGGIGKTTLMKAINNKLSGTEDFDVVIWVTVSKDFNFEQVQEEIMDRLGLEIREGDKKERRCAKLLEMLRRKRYLLILDDLWEMISLDEVGIPKPINQNGSKIAITTRFVEVCNEMEADVKIKMKTLSEAEAWNLFVAKVGDVVLDPHIQSHAKDVVAECDGLPLAIIVVGRAMRGKKKEELWQSALRALRASVPEIPGMEPQVFRPLKLSYDYLEDEKIKMCFLYCSLFPEDFEIKINRLVRYWIMEGFVENVDYLADAFNKGHHIAERIKDANLLEEVYVNDKYYVKMHDLLRDLAIWITSTSPSNHGPKFMVKSGIKLHEPPKVEKWTEVDRISLMMNDIRDIPFEPDCPNLVSLLMNENLCLTGIPSSFFEAMQSLQVLDLSKTSIQQLTFSSSSLLNLRALNLRECTKLKQVPSLGLLKELQFLDLKHSGIAVLPQDFEHLVKLKRLNLSRTPLKKIPRDALSRFLSMESLLMSGTSINWAKENEQKHVNCATLHELSNLTHLAHLKINIDDINSLPQEWSGQWPTLSKFSISIGQFDSNSTYFTPIKRQVQIRGSPNCTSCLKMMVTQATVLSLNETNIRNLSLVVGDSKSLRNIYARNCSEMDCIINCTEVMDESLQTIEKMTLFGLPKLEKLLEGQVPPGIFRRLKYVLIKKCNKIKRLFPSAVVDNLDQLETLTVDECESLEEIIGGDESFLPDNPLPSLYSIRLCNLKELRSLICCSTLALPALKTFVDKCCPKLRFPECPSITNIKNSSQPVRNDSSSSRPSSTQ